MADHDPTLTPGQEAEVRRLLADARHDAPIPDDVAARIDRALAELSPGTPATVTELASRRRRTAAITLAAAAVVVVAGVGLGQVIGTGHPSGGSASSAGAGRDSVSPPGEAASAPLPSGGSAAQGGAQPAAPGLAGRTPVPIRPQSFAADAAGTLDSLDSQPRALQGGSAADSAEAFRCRPAAWGPGTVVPVTYGGRNGVLVFRRATGDTRVADLYACGSARLLRSITLPVP